MDKAFSQGDQEQEVRPKARIHEMSFTHTPIDLGYDELERIEDGTGKREYRTPEGNIYPSITTCMSILSAEGIAEWRERVGHEEADRHSKKAADRGTRIHNLCEAYIKGEMSGDVRDVELRDRGMFIDLKRMIDRNIDKIYLQEKSLYSDVLKVAGTADCIAEWDGVLSVIDFKTSVWEKDKSYIQGYLQQASAYCAMFEERTRIPIRQIVVLIGVDGFPPQAFVDKRDNYMRDCQQTIMRYRKENGYEH